MYRHQFQREAALLAAMCVLVCTRAHGQATFQGVGDLLGGEHYSLAAAVSADGTVVVGTATGLGLANCGATPNRQAFKWIENVGMLGLGNLDVTHPYSQAYACSADGSVIF